MAPAALLVGAFVIVPFFWVIFVSFTNRTLLGRTALNPEFVGLQNYLALFDPDGFLTRGQFGFSLILTVQFVHPLGAGRPGAARACCWPGCSSRCRRA